MDIVECVSFMLVKDGKVLLEKRSQYKDTDPGLQAIPGGHIELGETQQQTLIRELKEELDITPSSYQFLCSLYHPTSELQILHYYIVTEWEGSITALEADEVNWFKVHNAPVTIDADKLALYELQRIGVKISASKNLKLAV